MDMVLLFRILMPPGNVKVSGEHRDQSAINISQGYPFLVSIWGNSPDSFSI